MKRASNTFSVAEIAAMLRVMSASDRRDTDGAQRYAQTPAALSARGKLQRMRDRILDAADEPEEEPDEPPRLVQKYKRVKWGADRGDA